MYILWILLLFSLRVLNVHSRLACHAFSLFLMKCNSSMRRHEKRKREGGMNKEREREEEGGRGRGGEGNVFI